ncbi:sensor histidine kinase [Yinghuangia aomiensis]
MRSATIGRVRRELAAAPADVRTRGSALGFLLLVVVVLGHRGLGRPRRAHRGRGVRGQGGHPAAVRVPAAAAPAANRSRWPSRAGCCPSPSRPSPCPGRSTRSVRSPTTGARFWAAVVPLSILWARPWDLPTVTDQIGNILIGLAPALCGLCVASRRRLIAALEERAVSAPNARAGVNSAPNTRPLRGTRPLSPAEMHDVVTHRVSLMVLQAGALRALAPRRRHAGRQPRNSASSAARPWRNSATSSRSCAARTASDRHAGSDQPRALDLGTLVADSRGAGVDVELDADPVPAAPPVVVRTAYRIVQESLTNVHKHAPGARVDVVLRHRDRWLRLEVRNTRPTGPCELVFPGEGTGLRGLRQRVEMVNGSLRAGPTGDGRFAVWADLPTGAPVESASGVR